MISGIVYYTLWKNYNEIMALSQAYKAEKMNNYSVLVRYLPAPLQGTDGLNEYFREMYATDFGGALVSMEIGKLTKLVEEYTAVAKQLERVEAEWSAIDSDTAATDKKRPQMRAGKLPVGKKVDAIEHLQAKSEKLKGEIEELRALVTLTAKKAKETKEGVPANSNSASALLSGAKGGGKALLSGAKGLRNVVTSKQTVQASTAGFVTFKTLAAASAAAQTNHAAAPGAVTVELAPEPREVYWPGAIMSPTMRATQGKPQLLPPVPILPLSQREKPYLG